MKTFNSKKEKVKIFSFRKTLKITEFSVLEKETKSQVPTPFFQIILRNEIDRIE